MSYDTLVRERITQLRLEKKLSEYQLSYELGQSKGYIQSITSGRTLPSLTMFFEICEYFELSPSEFFSEELPSPRVRKLTRQLNAMQTGDLDLIERLADRLQP